MASLEELRRALIGNFTQPVVSLLAKTSITPNTITTIGFLVTVIAALLIAGNKLFAAGFVVLLGGFFDLIDGALARQTNHVTLFGGVLDSTLDRLSEAALLLGVMFLYASEAAAFKVLLVGLALIGSVLVSYIRARAESQGLECKVGVLTRPERVVLMVLGLLFDGWASTLVIALAIIVVLSFVTAGQRLFYVWQQARR